MKWYTEEAKALRDAVQSGNINFLAVDVETANASFASICQIGVVAFCNDGTSCAWGTLVDPEDEFDWMNISIHGIEEHHVQSAPKWHEIYEYLISLFSSCVIVTHTPFDRGAIRQATQKYSLPFSNITWLDTARIVRRTWPQFSHSGYGLRNVANHLGINFKHHDALEDARACGQILISASAVTEFSIPQWQERVLQPINKVAIAQAGVDDGPLHGELAVFTGRLEMVRADAASLASRLGWDVEDRVTKRTTILVCGDQDIRVLNGNARSSKHRKAEDLIRAGQDIRILCEKDFKDLTKIHLWQPQGHHPMK